MLKTVDHSLELVNTETGEIRGITDVLGASTKKQDHISPIPITVQRYGVSHAMGPRARMKANFSCDLDAWY